MLGRRSFLKISAVSGAGLLCSGATAHAQSGVNNDMVTAAMNTYAVQTANAHYGSLSGADYANIQAVHQSLANDVTSKGLDGTFRSAIANVTVSQLLSVQLNPQTILSQVQIYASDMTLQDIQLALSKIPSDSVSLGNALNQLKQNGLSWHYQNIANLCNLIQAQNSSDGTAVRTRVTGANRVHPDSPERPFLPPPADSGGGYGCKSDSAAVFAAGAALMVLSLMAGPLGVLSEVAFWGAVTTYGGVGTTAWGAGHIAVCGL